MDTLTPDTLSPSVYTAARRIVAALARDDESRLEAALAPLDGDAAGEAVGLVLGALWNLGRVSLGDTRARRAALAFIDLHQQEGRRTSSSDEEEVS